MSEAENLSFTRGIFAGEVHDELIFSYPKTLDETNPEEAKIVRRLLQALESKLDGLVDSAKFDKEETIGDDVIQALARHGFLGMTIPKQYGGLGLSSTAYARVFESVAALDPSLGVFIGVHCGLGSKAIVLYGNEAQKSQWLPKLAKGEVLDVQAEVDGKAPALGPVVIGAPRDGRIIVTSVGLEHDGLCADQNGSFASSPQAAVGPGASGENPYADLAISRNAPCPCGSGNKYKHCHGALA